MWKGVGTSGRMSCTWASVRKGLFSIRFTSLSLGAHPRSAPLGGGRPGPVRPDSRFGFQLVPHRGKGGDHLLQLADHALVVVLGGGEQLLQLLVELVQL